jgi:hypothetical protein
MTAFCHLVRHPPSKSRAELYGYETKEAELYGYETKGADDEFVAGDGCRLAHVRLTGPQRGLFLQKMDNGCGTEPNFPMVAPGEVKCRLSFR